MSKIDLSEVTFNLSQEGNSNGSTDASEDLRITVESSLFLEKDDFFFTLRTNSGWSIENKEELNDLLDNCRKTVNLFLEGGKD